MVTEKKVKSVPKGIPILMALNIMISSEITENSNPPTITIKSARDYAKTNQRCSV